MESDKKGTNRVPAISEVAAVKKAAPPKPIKVSKAEKISKPANIKVVEIVLKESPETSSQPNTRLSPPPAAGVKCVSPTSDLKSQTSKCQLGTKPSSPTSTSNGPGACQQPTSCPLVTKQSSPGPMPNTFAANPQPASCQLVTKQPLPTPIMSPSDGNNEPPASQQSAPSELSEIQTSQDGCSTKTQSSTNSNPLGHHPPQTSQCETNQDLNNCKPVTNQPPAKSIIADQPPEDMIVANIAAPIINPTPAVQTQPHSNGQPTVPISNPDVACLTSQPSLSVSPVCQNSALPQAHTVSNCVPAQSVPLPPATSAATKVSKPKDEKHKKEDKSVQHVLRALNSLNTTEEKLAALCKKYADMFDENRKLQLLVKQHEKRVQMVHREKEQLQSEHSKAILTRSRLESLCRELQKQNKAVKEESIAKMREEEEKRTEISAKFQNTLSEITALMQQNNDKNNKLRDDNLDMTSRLKSVCEQYQLREQQVEKLGKQMELEVQLCDAKLAKAKMEMTAEKEILLREKQQLLLELTAYQTRCQELQSIEVDLRNQISLYNDKYDEFQAALSKSSQVFSTFKVEMEKMSKKITKLEKETSTWKKRWEQSHQAVLEMAVDKQVADQELKKTSRQLIALQSLCRTLQTERAQYFATVKKLTGKGGGELSEAEKMVNTESGPETIETLMTKIENESCNDVKENLPTNQPPDDAPPLNGNAQNNSPQANLNTSQPTQCSKNVPTAADNEKLNKNKLNMESKKDDPYESNPKTCAIEQVAPTTVSESLANIEACCNTVSSLIAAVSSDKPPCKPNNVSLQQEKLENKSMETPAASPAPDQVSQAETQEPLVPNDLKPDTAPSPANSPEHSNTAEGLKLSAAETNITPNAIIANTSPRSDPKFEILEGSASKVGPKTEKNSLINSNSLQASCPNGSILKPCDKKEPKLVPEQKKKESSKKRKK